MIITINLFVLHLYRKIDRISKERVGLALTMDSKGALVARSMFWSFKASLMLFKKVA